MPELYLSSVRIIMVGCDILYGTQTEMSATTPSADDIPGARPSLRATARRERYDGHYCGFYAYDGVDKAFIQYTIRHRKENAFPMSIPLYDEMLDDDVEVIYVVDKDTDDVYRFPADAYEDARTICKEQGESYAPHPVNDCTGYWEAAKDDLIPERIHWS